MPDLFTLLEESMLAATFAEAGEHDMAKALLGAGKTSRKKVLFGARTTELPPRIIRQAVEISKRNGAGLEIVHLLPPDAESTLGDQTNPTTRKRLELLKQRLMGLGILYEVVFGDSPLEEEIIRRATGRRDIMLIVLGKERRPGRKGGKSAFNLLERLHCPVVLLEEPRTA
ncbi:MAG: universal stress protein [Thermodesulfobacteriota bacterium]